VGQQFQFGIGPALGVTLHWEYPSHFPTAGSESPAPKGRSDENRLSRHAVERMKFAHIVEGWDADSHSSAKPLKGPLHNYTNYLYVHGVRNQAKKAPEVLFEIAEGQQGYFTSKQATEAGYQLGSKAHHVMSGNWVRVERGIYRLARFPQSPEEQLVIYTLWSRNRVGEPEGVYSHQTALSIHELSDVNPAKLHMTVPPAFRRSAKVPKILTLHYASLNEKDVEQRQGFAVTRPLRTIADLADAESVSRDIVEQAFTEGRQRGVITGPEMAGLRRRGNLPKWFDDLLAANKQ
jgi:hypothetical protein